MNNKPILIIIIILVLAGLGIYFWSGNSTDKATIENESEAMDQELMMEEEKVTGGEVMMKKGSYETYSPEKLALAETGKVALFFRASWCPTCRALDANIRSNLDNLPESVTILDVDYDNSTALKQKYGVTVQHTIVQVDASGNQIAKWQGSQTLSDLLSKLK